MKKESLEERLKLLLEMMGIPLKGKEYQIDIWEDNKDVEIIIHAFNVDDVFTIKCDKNGASYLFQMILLLFKALDIGIEYGYESCIKGKKPKHIYFPLRFHQQLPPELDELCR